MNVVVGTPNQRQLRAAKPASRIAVEQLQKKPLCDPMKVRILLVYIEISTSAGAPSMVRSHSLRVFVCLMAESSTLPFSLLLAVHL